MNDATPIADRKAAGGCEWEITFTLAAGYGESDAIVLYEYIEQHAAVSGAVLAGSKPNDNDEPLAVAS